MHRFFESHLSSIVVIGAIVLVVIGRVVVPSIVSLLKALSIALSVVQ